MPFLPVPVVARVADDLLPAARTLIDTASDAFAADPDAGVSCRAGCTACCSQAVPVLPAELRAVVAAITRLPDDQRSDVERRAREASAAIEAAGISPATFVAAGTDPAHRRAAAMRYLALDVPCPLLDGGVCAIRPDRPLACREYLVVSDPVHCAPSGVSAEQIVRIRSHNDMRRGFAEVSASFGEPTEQILVFALADALRDGAPAAPAAEPRSGPRTAAMLTPVRV